MLCTYEFDTADKNLEKEIEFFHANDNKLILVEYGKAIESVIDKMLKDLEIIRRTLNL